MIRLAANDLITVSCGEWWTYVLVLGKQSLFGGSLCYVFHERSRKPREASYFGVERRPGYHAIVDWIIQNRSSRVSRLAKGFIAPHYDPPGLFKHTIFDDVDARESKSGPLWFIVDEKFKERKRTRRLTDQEKRLPNFECLSGEYALKLAARKWVPEADSRISSRPSGRLA